MVLININIGHKNKRLKKCLYKISNFTIVKYLNTFKKNN